jgi:hypothetical protein
MRPGFKQRASQDNNEQDVTIDAKRTKQNAGG